jgi:hypothetical protein
MISSTNVLVHYKEKFIWQHLAYSVEHCLFLQLERAETEICILQDNGQTLKYENIHQDNTRPVHDVLKNFEGR